MGTYDLFSDLFDDMYETILGSKTFTTDELFDSILNSEVSKAYKDIFGEEPEIASEEEQEMEELLLKMHKHRREEL